MGNIVDQPGLDFHPRGCGQRPALPELGAYPYGFARAADFLPGTSVRPFDQDVAFARIVARELAFAYRAAVKKLKGYMARSSVERLAETGLD